MDRHARRPSLLPALLGVALALACTLPAAASMVTGSYQGDGSYDRAITGLGFRPTVVMVKADDNKRTIIRTATMPQYWSKPMGDERNLVLNRIVSLDSDGFSIGNDNDVNDNGRTYWYVAFSADPGFMATGNYVGDGSDGQTIEGLGLDPALVILIPGNNARCRFRTSTMPDGWSVPFDDRPLDEGAITGFVTGGFTVGGDWQVNELGADYDYVAFAADPAALAVGTYVGNAMANRLIVGANFKSRWALTKSEESKRGAHLPRDLAGEDYTLTFSDDDAFTGGIKDFTASGFFIGDNNNVNENDKVYHWAAFTNRLEATADLSATLTLSVDEVELGGQTTLTATLVNAGPAAATNAVLEVDVPAGLTELEVEADPGFVADESTPERIRLIYDLPAGEQRQVVATYEVDGGANLRTFVGRTTADQVDAELTNNEDSRTLTVPTAALALDLVASDPTPVAGDPVQFVLQLENTGPDDAPACTVGVAIPAGLTVTGATPTSGSFDAGTGTWSLGTVVAGDTPTLVIDADVGADQDGAALLVQAVAQSSRNDPEFADNEAVAALAVGGGSDLGLAMAFLSATAGPGDVAELELVLTNHGPDPVPSFAVGVSLPPGLGYQSHVVDSGSYDGPTGSWTSSALLAAGASATLTVSAVVNTDDAGTVSATASASSPETDPIPGNDTAAAELTLTGAFDLAASIVWSAPSATASDTVQVEIAVTNQGPGAATGFTAGLMAPTGFAYLDHLASAGGYDAVSGTWIVTDPLPAAGTETLRLRFITPSLSEGTYTATAILVPPAGEIDPTNDSASADIELNVEADLAVSAAFATPSANPGSVVNLQIDLVNDGPSDAADFTTLVSLPAGLQYQAHVLTDGDFEPGTGTWTAGSPLSRGETESLVLSVLVTSGLPGILHASVSASGSGSDPHVADNSDTADLVIDVFSSVTASSLPFASQERVLWPGGPTVDVLRLKVDNAGNVAEVLEGLTITNPVTGAPDQATQDGYWQDLELRLSTGAVLPLAGFTGGEIVVSGINQRIDPGGDLELTLRGAAALHAPDGLSLDPELASAADLAFGSGAAAQGDWPLRAPGSLTVDGMTSAQLTLHAVGAEVFQIASTRNLALDVVIPCNGDQPDRITKLNVLNAGTAAFPDEITRMEAWLDDGDGLFDAAVDARLTELHWTGGNRFEATSLDTAIPLAGVRVFVTVDVAPDALGGTVRLTLPAGDDPAVGVASGNDGPVDVAVTNPYAQTISSTDKIVFTTTTILSRVVLPGEDEVPLLSMLARNLYDQPHTLRRLSVSNISVGAEGATQAERDGAIGQLVLRRDGNGDRQLDDPSIDPVLATTTWVDGVAVFESVHWTLEPDSVAAVFLTATVSTDGVADGDSLAAAIGSPADLQFRDEVAVVGAWPLDSGARHPVDGMVAAQVGNAPVPPVSLTAGEGPVLALDVVVPGNGYRGDVLESLRLRNLGSAEPGDIDNVGLWIDDGDGIFEPALDQLTGSLIGGGQDWVALDLDLPVPAGGTRLFAGITVAATPADSSTVRLSIPVNGLSMASTNDGPHDAAVTSENTLLISTAPLLSSLSFTEQRSTTEMTTTVVMQVSNVGGERVNAITPRDLVVTGDGGLTQISGPVPASLDLEDSGTGSFTWVFACTGAGPVKVSGRCEGVSDVGGQPRGSLTTASSAHVVLQPSLDLGLYPVANMPFSINRGQTGVVPLTLTLLNEGGSGRAEVRLERLVVTMDDGDDNPVVPADLLSRVTVNEGVNVYCDRTELEDTGATMTLDLSPPVVVTATEPVTLGLRLNIRNDTTVERFRVSLMSAADLTVADHVSGQPRSVFLVAETFPVRSAPGSIVSQATGILVSALPQADRTASAGQDDAELLRLELTADGDDSASEVKVGSFAVALVDTLGRALPDAGARIGQLWVEGPLAVHAIGELESPADSVVVFELLPQITVPVGATAVTVSVHGQVIDDPVLGPLRLRLEPDETFDARDANNAADVLVTYQPSVPMGPTVTLQRPATSVELGIDGVLPPVIPLGAVDVLAMTMELTHPGPTVCAAVSLDTLRLDCLDLDRRSQDPGAILDAYRVLWNGEDLVVPVIYENQQLVIPLGGRILPAVSTGTLDLRVDIEAAAPAGGFELLASPGCLVARDVNLGTAVDVAPAPDRALPAGSGLARLQPPSDEVVAGWSDRLPPLLPTGDARVEALRVVLTNPAPVGAAPVELHALRLRTADRHGAVSVAGAVLGGVTVEIDGAPWTELAAPATDDTLLTLAAASPLLLAAGGELELVVKVSGREAAVTDGLRLGIDQPDLACVQPGTTTPVAVRPAAGLAFPFWTAPAGLGAASLAESYLNYPNPFAAGRDQTTFAFNLAAAATVSLRIWTPRGEPVITLLDERPLGGGLHQDIVWDGRNGRGSTVRNGVYLAELQVRFDGGEQERVLRKVAVVR